MQRRFSVCLDHETMQQALETLPDSLEAMYADVLMRQIPKDYREKARLMLMWLTYSIRPLRLRELAFVASLPDPMDVRRICTSSLVTLSREFVRSSKQSEGTTWNKDWMHRSEEDIIKFDHFSVKEYMMSEVLLASSGDSASYFFVPPLLAHLSIAQSSVSHLLDTNGSHFTEEDVHGKRRAELDEEVDGVSEQDVDVDTKRHVAVQRWPVNPWPEYPLLEYSTFWHRHVWEADAIDARRTSFDTTKINPSKSKAEDQSSPSRAENSRIQIHRLFCGTFPQSFKNWVLLLDLLTHEMLWKWPGVPSTIWCASLLNLPQSVQRLLQSEMDYGRSMVFDCFSKRQPEYARTPIQIAALCGHLKVLSVLLETDMPVEQSEFGDLVRDLDRNAGAVLNAILKSRPHLTITERIVERRRWGNSQSEIYRYILDSPGLVNLSKAMFVFIVKNFWDSSAVDVGFVEAVLRRGDSIGYSRGEMMEASVHGEESGRSSELVSGRYHQPSVSQKVLELMVVNERSGSRMLAVVLEHYKGVKISQDMLTLIVANCYRGAAMLIDVLEYDNEVQIGQDLLMLMVAATTCGTDMLAVVLKHRKGIRISQDLLVAVFFNYGSGRGKTIDLILEYDETIEVSEDMLKAAAGNWSGGEDIFSAIFKHNKKTKVNEDTLIAATGNTSSGAYILSAILSHDKETEVSENTLRAAARNDWNGGDIFSAILIHTKNIIISMEVICAIAENNKLGIHMMNLLMDHGSCDLELNGHFKFSGGLEEVMSDKLRLHNSYDNCELSISQEMMEAAARWEPDVIEFLIAHKRPNVTFTRSTTRPIPDDPNL